MSDKVIGNGSKLAFSIGSPMSWTEVPQIVELSGLEVSVDDIDNDRHSSVTYHRSVPGMFSVTPLEVTCIADKDEDATAGAVQEALRGLRNERTTVWWRTEVPTRLAQAEFKPAEFQGYIKSISDTQPIAEGQMFNFTVVFNGTSFSMLAAGSSEI